ncbi:glycosyl transferase family 28 [Ilyomonas limi]|uniref:Glycosyl transferase family 28 n=1 Tax=Ilyomonas limi TaxID=2575867 RepID=A0A4U3LAU6_9BACT|nr:glycosyltransferase [Ilyomonas limi]TKK71574.1 glycosyl transferase family 28 [Ilyomonas limi]
MFQKQQLPLKVLVAPLDWGLGHATRCVPLIQSLKQAQCHVYVAGNPTALKLLQQEVSGVEYLPLDGYNIQYSSKRQLAWKILKQTPKILLAIYKEHRWLKNVVTTHQIKIVFADNRYGLYHKDAMSIFITHQLRIKAPFSWLEGAIQKVNYRFINRFDACWVPDYAGKLNIAGRLSHPAQLPAVPVQYVGPLSRLKAPDTLVSIQYKWLILLSGPEPQRSILENLLLQAIEAVQHPVLLVRGLPLATIVLTVPPHCTVINHVPAKELQLLFAQSEYIISRSGYTTVMELLALGKKSILIPTPGQTEQEYLAKHLMQQQWCYSCEQHEDIAQHLQRAEKFSYQLPELPGNSLHAAVELLLQP